MHGAGEGTQPQPGPTGLAGVRLGRYELVRLIGAGSAGAVYQGLHVGLSRKVAVKIIDPHLAERPEARARLFQKAQLLSQLGHPHVVELIDLGTENGLVFLVMEYVDGEPLADHVRRVGPLSAADTVELVAPAIDAVAAIHAAGTTHGSLSARNLLIARAPDGGLWPKLTDFAIADGPAVADQHALGAMISQCVAGRSDLPAGFNRLIDRSMSARADQRFAAVTDLGRELLSFASNEVRARWTRTFGDVSPVPSPAVRAPAELRSPVPVTAYTPGHQTDLRSTTIAIQLPSASEHGSSAPNSIVTVGIPGPQMLRPREASAPAEAPADAWARQQDSGSHRTPSPFAAVPPPEPSDAVFAPVAAAPLVAAPFSGGPPTNAPATSTPGEPSTSASAAARTIAARPSALASSPPPPPVPTDAMPSSRVTSPASAEAARAARAAILQDPDPSFDFREVDRASDPADFSYADADSVTIPRSRRTWLVLGAVAFAAVLVAFVALRSPANREPETVAPPAAAPAAAPSAAPSAAESPPAAPAPPAAESSPEARAPSALDPARAPAAVSDDAEPSPAPRNEARNDKRGDALNDAPPEAPRAKARFGRNRAPLID